MASVITSQPRAQEDLENQDPDANTALTDEQKARKKRDENKEDVCCCILDTAEDTWCLCQCIAWCFRGMGSCLDGCCEGCAECISNCCESGETVAEEGTACCDCDW